MPRARSLKSPATMQAKLKALLLEKRAELVSKLREEREGRLEATSQREKIEGRPSATDPGSAPTTRWGSPSPIAGPRCSPRSTSR